jgi:hypothetical protein
MRAGMPRIDIYDTIVCLQRTIVDSLIYDTTVINAYAAAKFRAVGDYIGIVDSNRAIEYSTVTAR